MRRQAGKRYARAKKTRIMITTARGPWTLKSNETSISLWLFKNEKRARGVHKVKILGSKICKILHKARRFFYIALNFIYTALHDGVLLKKTGNGLFFQIRT